MSGTAHCCTKVPPNSPPACSHFPKEYLHYQPPLSPNSGVLPPSLKGVLPVQHDMQFLLIATSFHSFKRTGDNAHLPIIGEYSLLDRLLIQNHRTPKPSITKTTATISSQNWKPGQATKGNIADLRILIFTSRIYGDKPRIRPIDPSQSGSEI